MTTDVTVQNLIINKLTKQQYQGITTPSDTELYMVTDEVISSSDVTAALGYTPLSNSTKYGADLSYSSNSLQLLDQDGNSLGNSVTIQSSPDIDDKSITKNGSNELQTVGVINSQDSSTAIKTWTGTRTQYDAIVTKDANTLYNITDDTDVSLTILEALYPVGSVYITTANSCPLSTLISGSTWVLVSSGRVLQGADSGHSAGTTIEAGLPNITGTADLMGNDSGNGIDYEATTVTGAFTKANKGNSKVLQPTSGTSKHLILGLNAQNSNPIYGNSSTVQPPAYVVNIYRRTA